MFPSFTFWLAYGGALAGVAIGTAVGFWMRYGRQKAPSRLLESAVYAWVGISGVVAVFFAFVGGQEDALVGAFMGIGIVAAPLISSLITGVWLKLAGKTDTPHDLERK